MTVSPVHLDSPRTGTSRLAFDRTGSGEPLVLLHGQASPAAHGTRSCPRWPRTAT
jgi:hypothetical protein